VAAAAALIIGAEVNDADRDAIWALTSPEIYLLLVESSDWTADQYQVWMTEVLERALPRSSNESILR
jgi:hypothetical protein